MGGSPTAVAYTGSGELAAAYRKIHLFDSLGERESAMVAPARSRSSRNSLVSGPALPPVMTSASPSWPGPWWRRGAELIVVPTAWAAGLFKEEHWVTLVRARAIENTVWVAAAGQVPDPASPPTRAPTGVGRTRRLIPGDRRRDLGLWPQVTVARLDSDLTARARAVLPCLEHRRDDVFGPADPVAAAGLAAAGVRLAWAPLKRLAAGQTGPAGALPPEGDGLPGQPIRACHRTGCCPLPVAV